MWESWLYKGAVADYKQRFIIAINRRAPGIGPMKRISDSLQYSASKNISKLLIFWI